MRPGEAKQLAQATPQAPGMADTGTHSSDSEAHVLSALPSCVVLSLVSIHSFSFEHILPVLLFDSASGSPGSRMMQNPGMGPCQWGSVHVV